jgi:hypothetical protein
MTQTKMDAIVAHYVRYRTDMKPPWIWNLAGTGGIAMTKDTPDRETLDRIDPNNQAHVAQWTHIFDCTAGQLSEAVAAVGPQSSHVKHYLRAKRAG